MRRRRAPLFMPGDSEHKIAKAAGLEVDSVVLDLEDAVTADRKAEARSVTARLLAELDFGGRERLVRINPVHGGLEEEDLEATISGRPDGYVLPKLESAESVRWASRWLAAAEETRGWEVGSIALCGLIESARGVVALREIAAADGRLRSLWFGAEDFCASVGATRSPEGIEVLHARAEVVVTAAAFGIQAVDTLFVDFRDDAGLRHSAEASRRFGFDGMMAIHPRQVEIIHAAFTPTPEEVAAAEHLLEAFARHTRAGRGAFSLDGRMVDMPMVRSAERVLAQAGRTVPGGEPSA